MALSTGTRLGACEIQGPLGAGGMGEVYRARDRKLNRDVALKVLPELFALDPDRLGRFRREAELLASLNHPNIAAIYGFEESNGVQALVLELVEGPTLADRIARGPVPMDEALPIAQQIAEALEAAHEQTIIHRDLKPANIKLRPDGVVKVLDFGLAKALEPASAANADVTALPTITSPAMTRMGVILGTAAYMSPEQAKGREADKRSDVWAFGCVLYEMLTGKRAFEGEDVSDTLANVLKTQPNWNALPETTPPAIRRLLRRSLEKDRKRRLPDIADARLEIDEALETLSGGSVDARDAISASSTATRTAWLGVRPYAQWSLIGALTIALAAVLALWAPWRTAVPPTPLRMSVELGAEDASLVTDIGAAAVLSPDGQMLAFVAQKGAGAASQLYIRRLEQLQATPLAGTDEARSPFFSPDGQWVAFFAGGKLKKISVTGGATVTLCDAPNGRGGNWAEDGTIVFLPNTGGTGVAISLQRVSSAGGKPEQLIAPDRGTQRWPQVLPNGKAVLYTSYSPSEGANLVVQPLPTGERKVVQPGGGYGRYLPSGLGSPKRADREGGHLVYIQGATLFAAPFDLERLDFTGQPVPVLDGVAANENMAAAQFAVSDTGTVVYLPGQTTSSGVPIAWMDGEGKTTPLRTVPANWSNPHFATDGRRLAVDIVQGANADVWVYEWARDTLSRLTFDAASDEKPVWTPDDRRIVFSSTRGNKSTYNLYWQRADGTGDVQRLTESPSAQYAASWHPSGKLLAFRQNSSPQTSWDVMILPIEGDETSGWKPGKPTVFLNGPFLEDEPMFSPDGRWLAYTSFESGRAEVYVRPFPGPGGKWQVSTEGGGYPTWSRIRPELFYGTPDLRIMVAPYTVEGDSFRADKPRLWSEARFTLRPRQRGFDLHPDGNRFAVAAVPETQVAVKQDKVVLIFNFFDELRRLAPTTTR